MRNLLSFSFRQRALFVSALCAASLGAAVVLQHVFGWEPCPLCILQRLALVGLGVFSLLAALLSKRKLFSGGFKLLATSAAGGGAWAAYEQLTLLWGPQQFSCGAGLRMFIMRLSDRFPFLDWLLEGPADCGADANLVLGLPLAFWVLSLLVVCAVTLWLPQRTTNKLN